LKSVPPNDNETPPQSFMPAASSTYERVNSTIDTELIVVAGGNNLPEVRRLLRGGGGADVNAKNSPSGWTPLIGAGYYEFLSFWNMERVLSRTAFLARRLFT
jgi:hypothetical protein